MNRIRELRERKGWRQEDLAARLHKNRQSVGNYETETRGLDVETINKLCDIFGCTSDYLLGRSLLPTAELTEEEAALLLAYRSAEPHIQTAISALLEPYKQKNATSA